MTKNLIRVVTAMIAFTGCSSALGDEPGWSDAERAKRSDAVFVGKVVSVQRSAALSDYEDQYLARIQVTSVDKSTESIENSMIVVLFAGPKDGDVGKRCPSYVELEVGQTARFFVRNRKVANAKGNGAATSMPWLEMGSDVGHTNELSPILSNMFSAEEDASAVAAARKIGAESATADINNGKLRILYYGKPRSSDKPLIDDETGYRVQIVAGCIVSTTLVAEVDAYNLAMKNHFLSRENEPK